MDSVSEASDGVDRVLKALDAAFQYDNRVEMPRPLKKFFFYQLSRKSDQTLLAYCAQNIENCFVRLRNTESRFQRASQAGCC